MPIILDDENRNVLFIHIPKTGGTSIEKSMDSAGYKIGMITNREFEKETKLNFQHFDKSWIEGNNIKIICNESFAVVRNPILRFYSEYEYRKKTSKFIREFVSFDSFVMFMVNYPTFFNERFDGHALPQVNYVFKDTKVFKLEDGMNKVTLYLKNNGFNKLNEVGHFNKTHKNKVISITESNLNKLKSIFKDDLETFNYDVPKEVVISSNKGCYKIISFILYVYLKIKK